MYCKLIVDNNNLLVYICTRVRLEHLSLKGKLMTNKVAKIDEMSLTAIADEINAIYSNVENEHMRTAILLAQARSKFELDSKGKQLSDAKINSGFIKWARDNTPYNQTSLYSYLAVDEKFRNVGKNVFKPIANIYKVYRTVKP